MKALDIHISLALNHHAAAISQDLKSDVMAYVGPIYTAALPQFVESIEEVKSSSNESDSLAIVLTTPGGVVECVEKMVEVTRHQYKNVAFIVPESAMSAGTIWCMSGDKIWMDYSSSLGPIDPQVESQNRRGFVPALGYIEKFKELSDKAEKGSLNQADLVMLKSLDLAELHRFEQARDLSISLLKEWLVKYKFKNWTKHRTTNPGAKVTPQEKQARAEAIATELSSSTRWHSHGRMIGMDTLQKLLRLEIDDFSKKTELAANIKMYHGLLVDYMEKQGLPLFIHSPRR